MSEEKLEIWNKLFKSDPEFVKQFEAIRGGFSGSSPNPMYMAKRLTEEFGPIGDGWGHYEISHEITDVLNHEDGNVERLWSVDVAFWYLNKDGKRCEQSHRGQATLAYRTADRIDNYGKLIPGRWITDSQAPKKARTDGWTKAASQLGLCGDIWFGLFDDDSYRSQRSKEEEQARANKSQENSEKMLTTALEQWLGCKSDNDKTAVLQWLFPERQGISAAAIAGSRGFASVALETLRTVSRQKKIPFPEMLLVAKGISTQARNGNGKAQKPARV